MRVFLALLTKLSIFDLREVSRLPIRWLIWWLLLTNGFEFCCEEESKQSSDCTLWISLKDGSTSVLVLKSHFALQCFQPSTLSCTTHPPLLLTQSDGMTQWMSNDLRWGLLIQTLYWHDNDDAHPVDRERRAHVEMCPYVHCFLFWFFFNHHFSMSSDKIS